MKNSYWYAAAHLAVRAIDESWEELCSCFSFGSDLLYGLRKAPFLLWLLTSVVPFFWLECLTKLYGTVFCSVFYQTQHKARLDHPLDPLYLCRSIYFVPCCSPIGGFLRPEMIIACRKWSHHVLMRSLRSPFSFLNCSSFVLLLSAFDEEKVIKCHHSWIFPPYIEAEHRSSNKFRCLGRLSIKSSTENITFWNQFHIYRA